jgi:phosphoribosyl 1,2-cyclic phosphodiesterase
MRLALLASGSNGNACYLEVGETRLLIDVGIGPRTLASRLAPLGIEVSQLTDLLLTHAHHDHLDGVAGLLARQPELAIHATAGTTRHLPREARRRTHRIKGGQSFAVGALTVVPFAVSHDAPGPVGFRIESGEGRLGYATDLGKFDAATVAALSEVELLVVEANHCPQQLAAGPYPRALKRRIAGPEGHLSNQQCRLLLERLLHPRLAYVALAHLSEANNTAAAAEDVVADLRRATPGTSWALGSRSGALPAVELDARSPAPAPAPSRGRQLVLPI